MNKFEKFKLEYGKALLSHWDGTIMFGERDMVPAFDAANRLFLKNGFKSIGENWTELDTQPSDRNGSWMNHSTEHFINRLQFGMADNGKRLSSKKARALVLSFSQLFDSEKSRCLTNRFENTWHSVTGSTFDAAYVLIDRQNIGGIILKDED